MIRVVRFLIRAYQWTISPMFSFLAGPGSGCRFIPLARNIFSKRSRRSALSAERGWDCDVSRVAIRGADKVMIRSHADSAHHLVCE